MTAVSRRKACVLAAAMASAGLLAAVGKPTRRWADVRPRVVLDAVFPAQMGAWQLDRQADVFVRPANERGKLYGIYDQVLERIYVNGDGERVMLSVAYGTEQSVGLQVHRPEVCYPSSGFVVSGLRRLALSVGGRQLQVTQLHAQQPGRSEPITYWTVLGDVVQNDERAFRWRQLSFGLRGQILDGMLVRVSSIDGNAERAWQLHLRFAQALAAALGPVDQTRVLGTAPA